MTGYESKKAAAQDKLAQPAQEPDWKALVLEHNADCDSLCDMDECGYKEYFEFSNRRCPTCPVKQKIDVNYATQPSQRPWVGLTEEDCDEVERWVEFKEEGSDRIQTSKLIRYIEAKLKEKNNAT